MLVGAPSPVNTLAAPSKGRAGTAREALHVHFDPRHSRPRPSRNLADATRAPAADRARPGHEEDATEVARRVDVED